MIQFHKFTSGGFVLHEVMIQGQKYSAWFTAGGSVVSAECVYDDKTVDVNLDRQHKIAARLVEIAQPYVGR